MLQRWSTFVLSRGWKRWPARLAATIGRGWARRLPTLYPLLARRGVTLAMAGLLIYMGPWMFALKLDFAAPSARCTRGSEVFWPRYNEYVRPERGFSVGYAAWLFGEDWFDRVGKADLQSSAYRANPSACQRGMLRGDFGTSWIPWLPTD